MSNNTKAISFWNFLKENTIEIPIIQRDYAQGRLGKETLRKNFLRDLKNALDKGETIKLDFVYGSTENDILNPLDGQQRLTTLWLLHWYIALRAGELSEDNCMIFRKFTYETRISSREFCQNLCVPEYFQNFDGKDIVRFIIKQTWFYSAWKQDPTIQSMLRMLGGTKIVDKKGEDIVDGIEEIFQGTSEDGFKLYLENLTTKEVIVFYHLPLEDFGLSDDLYIKMNARGKQLTSFENFKADLIGYITKQAEDSSDQEWKKLLDAENGIPIMLDTDWTDIFWKNKSKDNKIDENYFAFINRYFFQELVCATKEDNSDLYSADNIEKENGSFSHLYGNKSDDSQLYYSGLEKYLCFEDKTIPLSFFKSVKDTLDNYKSNEIKCCLNDYFPVWADSKFEFIPKYDETGIITTLGQKERVVFLAISRYFEKDSFDETSFKRWMRVVWNIVENSGIETISAMIGAMRLIDELSEGAHDIYNFLSNSQLQIKSNFAKEQVAEEIAKAKQILSGAPRSDGKSWEGIIIKAEKFVFFKGAIRFLFTQKDIGDDWEHFDAKWANAQEYFDKDGVKDGNENNKLYKSNALLMKSLLANCDDFEKRIWWHFEFSNDANRWKRILTSSNWKAAVDAIMGTEITDDETSNFIAKINDPYIKNIVDDGLMNYVCTNMSGAWIRSTYHGYHAIWQRGYPSYHIALNPILARLKVENNIEYSEKNKIENCRYYKCVDKNVDFKYGCHFFRWWGYPNEKELDVYLMENDWANYKERPNPTSDKGTDEDRYYCFRVTKDMESDPSKFTDALDELIKKLQIS